MERRTYDMPPRNGASATGSAAGCSGSAPVGSGLLGLEHHRRGVAAASTSARGGGASTKSLVLEIPEMSENPTH